MNWKSIEELEGLFKGAGGMIPPFIVGIEEDDLSRSWLSDSIEVLDVELVQLRCNLDSGEAVAFLLLVSIPNLSDSSARILPDTSVSSLEYYVLQYLCQIYFTT